MADPRDIQIHQLQETLRWLSYHAAKARNTNTPEWLARLVEMLNEAGCLLIEPKRFIGHQGPDGDCWITGEDVK